ncbi:HAMP domain-containing protein [Paenibacillus sp. HN-1]|uniref:HAMP domain-containing sensor histidine kinase n=1 Tax=Paenibacillus TaxID=44249 RepID=UPI001CA9A0DC|nr:MULTISPECIES: ATP-binding protein [Paenibacillus]MBY9078007.1 HAMP domain-containing protein [Paenibacillus sp. CGMCC 1.18879]MBY9083748.1 HAMP domain-containing protein [Paenibacillus sinensis]
MSRVRSALARMSIRWKLTLWAAALMCILFLTYNGIQYVVINHWMFGQAQSAALKSAGEIRSYFEIGKVTEQSAESMRPYVESLNSYDQLIRILNSEGTPLITVADHLPLDWVAPENAVHTSASTVWYGDDHLLVVRSPIRTATFTGTVEIVNNLENSDKLSSMILAVMLAGLLGAFVLSGLGGVILSRKLLGPVRELTDTMNNMKRKGLQERVTVPNGGDELGHLAAVFNELMDQLEEAFQAQQQFVADASHELRTPISIIEGHISLLNRWGKHDPAILEESLQVSAQELSRLKGIVNDLLELTRAEAVRDRKEIHATQISETVRYTVKNFTLLHPDFDFALDTRNAESASASIKPQTLEQVLLILMDNAVKYSADRKEISVQMDIVGDHVAVSVMDRGIGIPGEDLPHVFRRFYRAEKSRSREQGGTGLGLAIAERLMKGHGGSVEIQNRPGGGTKATLLFPLSGS